MFPRRSPAHPPQRLSRWQPAAPTGTASRISSCSFPCFSSLSNVRWSCRCAFSRPYLLSLREKLSEITASVLSEFPAGQHYTRVDSVRESLSPSACAQRFELTSFFSESYIPQSFLQEMALNLCMKASFAASKMVNDSRSDEFLGLTLSRPRSL